MCSTEKCYFWCCSVQMLPSAIMCVSHSIHVLRVMAAVLLLTNSNTHTHAHTPGPLISPPFFQDNVYPVSSLCFSQLSPYLPSSLSFLSHSISFPSPVQIFPSPPVEEPPENRTRARKERREEKSSLAPNRTPTNQPNQPNDDNNHHHSRRSQGVQDYS